MAGLQQETPMGDPAAGDSEVGGPGSFGRSHLSLRTELREASASLQGCPCMLL